MFKGKLFRNNNRYNMIMIVKNERLDKRSCMIMDKGNKKRIGIKFSRKGMILNLRKFISLMWNIKKRNSFKLKGRGGVEDGMINSV